MMVKAMLSLFYYLLTFNPRSTCLFNVSQTFCFRTCVTLSACTLYTENTVEKENMFILFSPLSALDLLAHHSQVSIPEYTEGKLGYGTSKI